MSGIDNTNFLRGFYACLIYIVIQDESATFQVNYLIAMKKKKDKGPL